VCERLHNHPDNHPPFVAIAIRRTHTDGPPPGLHTGIIYRAADDAVLLLHLGFHYQVANEPPSSRYIWAVPDIPDVRLRSVAALCRLVASIYPTEGLPYALRYDGTSTFSTENGRWLAGTGGRGFTCSTFVLALFQSCGISLIDWQTWCPRSSDLEWQRFIIQALQSQGADASHVAGVCSEIGCLRFRPDEVTGACLGTDYPVPFVTAISAGIVVLEALDQHYTAIGYCP